MRDKIICGITDNQVKASLLEEMDMNLQRIVVICRASENYASQTV